ncbi:unnamed protein product [Ciceribacter sp. T2.26MG-112.2]|uniref:hypothetical protein n=1 Tax=Ciceribacter sp. T2.26MG-112.2 TaxID=3137154 RepID=UPI000E145D89|nr:hypothetical protein [Ciceribacter naphthalenivorans]SSC73185.1 unnamed protein product [Ciceribacter naphthalenivorans]
MKKFLAGFVIFLGAASGALAASVTNSGTASIVLQVVEDGNRSEVAIDAGASETICPSGCFVTLPNGDRLGLEGGESVEIKDGSATVK